MKRNYRVSPRALGELFHLDATLIHTHENVWWEIYNFFIVLSRAVSPQLANVWVPLVDGKLAGAGAVVGAGVAAVHKVGGVLVGGLTARHDDCGRGAHRVSYSRGARTFWHLQTQQTPNPPAQGPLATPPRSKHSLAARQVPLSPETAPHSRLSKRTTENSERTAKIKRLSAMIFLGYWKRRIQGNFNIC
jgi:hypothetical protein